jgi:hypothetical protein
MVRLAVTSIVLLAVLAQAGPVRPAPESPAPPAFEALAGSGAAPAPAPFRLPASNRADAERLPVEGGSTLEIGARGELTLGEFRADATPEGSQEILDRLYLLAEEQRDEEELTMPSLRAVVLRADAATPWRFVRAAMCLPVNPSVRIFRVYWAARVGDEEVGLPVFANRDHGLARTKTPFLPPIRVPVTLSRTAGGDHTEVALLGEVLGRDEAGLDAFAARLRGLVDRVPDLIVKIEAGEDVPFEHVVRALDPLPSPGYSCLGYFTDFTDGMRGLLGGAEGSPGGTPEELEARFVPEEEDRPRVRELLLAPELFGLQIDELAAKIRPSRPLALALGRAWLTEGGIEACRRAVALGALVVEGEPGARYDATWWGGEELILRGILGCARAAERPAEAERALERIRALEDLGLLDRSPRKAEILDLRREAKALAGAPR